MSPEFLRTGLHMTEKKEGRKTKVVVVATIKCKGGRFDGQIIEERVLHSDESPAAQTLENFVNWANLGTKLVDDVNYRTMRQYMDAARNAWVKKTVRSLPKY